MDDAIGRDRTLVLDPYAGHRGRVAGVEALAVAALALVERRVDEDLDERRREPARGIAERAAMRGRCAGRQMARALRLSAIAAITVT